MNKHELDQTVKNYLIECMNLDGYDVEEPPTKSEKIAVCKDVFNDEYGKWLSEKVGVQIAIKEWLQGLPSFINIAIANDEILEIAVTWGSIPENYSERQADKILENWFNLLAAKLLQLFNGYHVPKD